MPWTATQSGGGVLERGPRYRWVQVLRLGGLPGAGCGDTGGVGVYLGGTTESGLVYGTWAELSRAS